MDIEIANGIEKDGIKYRCFLKNSPYWCVEITHPNGKTKTEEFHWSHEPRCGPDISDVNMAEVIMDKLIIVP